MDALCRWHLRVSCGLELLRGRSSSGWRIYLYPFTTFSPQSLSVFAANAQPGQKLVLLATRNAYVWRPCAANAFSVTYLTLWCCPPDRVGIACGGLELPVLSRLFHNRAFGARPPTVSRHEASTLYVCRPQCHGTKCRPCCASCFIRIRNPRAAMQQATSGLKTGPSLSTQRSSLCSCVTLDDFHRELTWQSCLGAQGP